MQFAGTNYLAIVIAAVASFAFGAFWYTILGERWLAAQGKSVEAHKEQQKALQGTPAGYLPFVISFIALLVMAWVLAGLIGHLGPGQVTLRNGVISGAFVWLGFVITTLATNHAFQSASRNLTLIDGGHWLGVLLVQGAVIGAFGV